MQFKGPTVVLEAPGSSVMKDNTNKLTDNTQ